MFKLVTDQSQQTYMTSVSVEMLEENGKKKTHVFKAKFRRLTREELDALSARVAASRDMVDGDPDKIRDVDVLSDVMVGWAEVMDENGVAVEFNPDNFAALLNVHPVRPTLVNAFYASVYGSSTKN